MTASESFSMACGVSASLNNRSDAGSVVSSLVLKLKIQEIKTRNGLFHRLPTNVTDGSGKCAMAFEILATTTAMSSLVKSLLTV